MGDHANRFFEVQVLYVWQSHFIPIGIVGYMTLRIIYLLWFHPLSDVPGPKIAAVTDLWKTRAVLWKCFGTTLRKQHEKFGDVIRIGPNEVSIIAPEDVQMVYGHKSKFRKGPFYDAFSLVGKSHFSDRDEGTHAVRRRSITKAYSISHLTSLETYCDKCTDLFFHLLDKASRSGTCVDLSELILWYTYDCVSEIGFGIPFGFLASGKDSAGMLQLMSNATHAIVTAATLTNFGWILPTRPVSWLASSILGDRGPNLLIKYAAKFVKARQTLRKQDPMTYEDRKDMLYRFMETVDPTTSQPLPLASLMSNTITIIQAGADTTRTSMIAFLRYVYAHPATLRRLRQEMDDAISSGHLDFPVTYTQAIRLEFLWACMKEAMRLCPAVGMPLQRVVPAGGCVIGGRYYRAGTLVGMAPSMIHNDARAYGPDSRHWRPERWLEGKWSELELCNLTFGQGTRVCLGKNLSLMEMSKLLPSIVYHYDIIIQNPEQPWMMREAWFQTPSDFLCTVLRRDHTQ